MLGIFLNFHIYGILKECNRKFIISDELQVKDLLIQRSFRGLINEYVRSDRFSPNVKDIAVAINIASEQYIHSNPIHESNIIDLAYHICTEIKKRIAIDSSLRETFNHLGKSASNINNDISRAEIEAIFKDKRTLF